MNDIVGIYLKTGKFSYEEISKLKSLIGIRDSAYWNNSRLLFAFCDNDTHISNQQKYTLIQDSVNGINLVADARLDYVEELRSKLGESTVDPIKNSDNHLILKSYLRWGLDCSKHLFGDFSYAIWDENREVLCCSRDHFGCKPFYYIDNDKNFIFSSSLDLLANIPDVTITIDERVLIGNAMGRAHKMNQSFFKEVRRLLPANNLIFKGIKSQIHCYWELHETSESGRLSEKEAVTELERLFKNSVEQRIRNVNKVAVELSGGLDSSAISAIASESLKSGSKSLYAFSHAISERHKSQYFPFRDETKYSDIVVSNAGNIIHEKVTSECLGAYNALEFGLEKLKSPELQNYSLFSDELLRSVRDKGCTVLLSGLGGDEMVTSNAKGFFDEIIENRNWKLFYKELEYLRSHNSIWLYILYYSIKFFPFLFRLKDRLSIKSMVSSSCVYGSIPIRRVLKRSAFSRVCFIKSRSRKGIGHVKEQQKSDILHRSLSSRIENSYSMGRKYGVEYRYPMLDVKLIEFYYSLPLSMKYKQGVGRYIFRQFIKEHLPEEIAFRRDKGGVTIPNVFFRINHDMHLFRELIKESEGLYKFQYFNYKKLNRMANKVEQHTKGKRICFGPRLFLFAMQILILQKWQYEGKIDIGIKS